MKDESQILADALLQAIEDFQAISGADLAVLGPISERAALAAARCHTALVEAAKCQLSKSPPVPCEKLRFTAESVLQKFRRVEIFAFQAAGFVMAAGTPQAQNLAGCLRDNLVSFRKFAEGDQ